MTSPKNDTRDNAVELLRELREMLPIMRTFVVAASLRHGLVPEVRRLDELAATTDAVLLLVDTDRKARVVQDGHDPNIQGRMR